MLTEENVDEIGDRDIFKKTVDSTFRLNVFACVSSTLMWIVSSEKGLIVACTVN